MQGQPRIEVMPNSPEAVTWALDRTPEAAVPRIGQRVAELLALAVSLVAGYFYLEELGRRWLFWLLALLVVGAVVAWHGRRRIGGLLRRLR